MNLPPSPAPKASAFDAQTAELPDSTVAAQDMPRPEGSGQGKNARDQRPSEGGNDAICFTAGFSGLMFGAGTIHAYLAARRKPPAVVAGISAGAINAAAMQRCYQDLLHLETSTEHGDASRWKWYRQYLSMITDEPLGVIWRGLPRLTDFSADLPPVEDTSVRSFAPDSNYWTDQEKRARRELYLFMRLAGWVARLPLKVSLLASMVVNYVRLTERIPDWRTWRAIKYYFGAMYIALVLVLHTALRPFWFKESRFKTTPNTDIKFYKPSYWLRPLLGWPIFFLAWSLLLTVTELSLAIAIALTPKGITARAVMIFLMKAGAVALLAIFYVQRRPIQRYLWGILLPLIRTHLHRIAWTVFLFAAEWTLFGLNDKVHGSTLVGTWQDVWDYAMLLLAILFGLSLLVVLALESFALAAPLWRAGRTWADDCKRPVLWGASLLAGEGFLIITAAYLIKGSLLTFVFTALSVLGAVSLLSLAALRFFPIARDFSQKHLHPVVPIVLRAPWTVGLIVLEAGCIGLIFFWDDYRIWAEVLLVALVCMESLGIAARLILEQNAGKEEGQEQLPQTFVKRIRSWIGRQVFRRLEMERALVHKFQLLMRLTRLFGEDGKSRRLTEEPMPVLIVAAPLQTMQVGGTKRGVSQVWARKGIRIVDALAAAVALPGLFEPSHLDCKQFTKDADEIALWEIENPPEILDLVDGAKIRENPLPSLFQFLRKAGREHLAESLSSSPEDPRIHIVFTVPIGEHESSLKPTPLGVNVVDVALASLRLNQRRDSELEIEQTNFISALELALRKLAKGQDVDLQGKRRLYPIFADAIAPEDDLTFSNPLSPDPNKVLTMVADGCRRTLETVYKNELRVFQPKACEVSCADFFSSRNPQANGATGPGLPEVCRACTSKLKKCATQETANSTQVNLERFSHLSGTSPRIVFLASGGVFRGSFHAGMLACLLATDIRPDVIVGASVGTLMGGVLGAMLTARTHDGQMKYSLSLRLLADLVDVLMHVDQEVAFTKVLKTAAREFGIRARSVKLSPNQVRRMVKRGSRRDPGYAATGAPPALIDGISNLLFIPHTTTAWIAAQFVAGHVTQATKKLLKEMKKETLKRLDIEYSLMGVSLLEPVARRLLGTTYGIPLDVSQPFLCDKIAFFATTTNLQTETTFLLGREFCEESQSFDFVQGTLASSAFPAIFAPRRKSDVFPGTGETSVLFSDGGMFDNFPFIPAIEFMSAVQRKHCSENVHQSCISFLEKRHAAPDLFIAGSLNVPPEEDEYNDGDFDDVITIHRRASSLQYNIKIRAFQETAESIHEEVELLLKNVPKNEPIDEATKNVINGLIEAEVLPVFPIDREHLNPTYAFCASVGLKMERVQRSIVNGCFQTFAALANAQLPDPPRELRQAKRSIDVLIQPTVSAGQTSGPQRIPVIQWRPKSGKPKKGKGGTCPYFVHTRPPRRPRKPGEPWVQSEQSEPHAFICPFFQAYSERNKDADKDSPESRKMLQVQKLYRICSLDTKQIGAYEKAVPK